MHLCILADTFLWMSPNPPFLFFFFLLLEFRLRESQLNIYIKTSDDDDNQDAIDETAFRIWVMKAVIKIHLK